MLVLGIDTFVAVDVGLDDKIFLITCYVLEGILVAANGL